MSFATSSISKSYERVPTNQSLSTREQVAVSRTSLEGLSELSHPRLRIPSPLESSRFKQSTYHIQSTDGGVNNGFREALSDLQGRTVEASRLHSQLNSIQSCAIRLEFRFERNYLARFVDRIGYIPVVGTFAGAARMISSVVIGVFALLGSLLASGLSRITKMVVNGEVQWLNRAYENSAYTLTRSRDEFFRGVIELVPFLSGHLDNKWKSNEHIDSQAGKVAYGRYMSESGQANGNIEYIFEKTIIS